MKIDFLTNYKNKFESLPSLSAHKSWDVYVSAYNNSQRVNETFQAATATHKLWVIVPEYAYSPDEHPTSGNLLIINC